MLGDQLTTLTRNGKPTLNYSYDKVGNRLGGGAIFNTSNQLTSTTTAAYTYDANGNVLTKTEFGRVTTYTWDFENRLTSVTQPKRATVNFKYDPFGRRIQKTFASSTTNYLYDGVNLISELDQSGSVIVRYTQGAGIDEPLALQRSGANYFYEADGLGSVTSVTNATGNIVDSYRYDAFGKPLATISKVSQPFRYTGREFDSETGLYYYRARYYDQANGRFLSEDPMAFDAGVNFYQYVGGHAINLRDPLGLRPGQHYRNLDSAGIRAIKDILDKSICENKEYAGALYLNADGTYSYTAPSVGTNDSSVVPPIPTGATLTGDYHTHGAYDPNYDNENFSPGDKDTNDVEGFGGSPGYLGTPKGAIKKYKGDRFHPRQGAVIILAPGVSTGNQKHCKCR